MNTRLLNQKIGRYIGSKSKNRRRRPIRILIEGFIFLFVGISLGLFLNQLPEKLIINEFALTIVVFQ